ncbi:MAG: alpha/beta hydrolase-fold protein [Chitinophagaceae bacterium]
MLKLIPALAGVIITTVLMAQHKVTVRIGSLPPHHAAGSDIFIVGTFNGWNPNDVNYRFQHTSTGYEIHLSLADGDYEYKVTRGGWNKVECKKDGSAIDNHLLKVTTDTSLTLDIEEWSDRFPAHKRASTASKNVHIVDTAFFIPQLNRTRRIWIYLPEEYERTVEHYSVLYMQDGQNVFDEATAFADEWGIDEYFDKIADRGITTIVIAIDNGGSKRMNEYSPYDTEKFGKGEGDDYVDFLVKTVKPFIDQHYRTKQDKANTTIAGSSMGGLISLYAIIKYPDVFGGAGIFSPSLWIAPKLFDEIKLKGPSINSKIYFYSGKNEGGSMAEDTRRAYEIMKQYSPSKLTLDVMEDGKHDEPSWRKEFPKFYEWMREEGKIKNE